MYKYTWWHQTGSCTANPLVLYQPAQSPSLPQTTVLWLSQTAAAPQLPSLPPLHCWRPPGRDHPAATARQRSHSQMDTQRTSRTTEYDFHQTISKKHLLPTYSTVEVRPPRHDGVCGWSSSEQLSYFSSKDFMINLAVSFLQTLVTAMTLVLTCSGSFKYNPRYTLAKNEIRWNQLLVAALLAPKLSKQLIDLTFLREMLLCGINSGHFTGRNLWWLVCSSHRMKSQPIRVLDKSMHPLFTY